MRNRELTRGRLSTSEVASRIVSPLQAPIYYLETDGSALPGERHNSREPQSVGGAGIVLWDSDLRAVLTESIPLGPVSCGPEAELRAVLIGLRRAMERGVERVRVRSDCLAVIRHLTGEEELETAWAAPVKEELRTLLRSFDLVEARWTRASHASERRAGVPTADALARRAVGLGSRRG